MNQVIMILMAFGAVTGGLDRILGNRFGLGEKFEEGFRLMGSLGLSMAGIICLTPLLSGLLGRFAAPLCTGVGLDPGLFGGILAIDMGGYQLAMSLAENPAVGRFAGIVISAIFGCTVVFTIPVGMGTIEEADKPLFSRGLFLGLLAMPAALFLGGLLSGLGPGQTAWQCVPFLVGAGLLLLGMGKWQDKLVRGFGVFAQVIRVVTTLGLILGAVQYMTGWTILPGLAPLEEAMEVVSAIAIVMLGSMPLAELIQRLLKKPFGWVGHKTGLNTASTTGLLVGAVSVVPALVMMKDMDPRGKVVNAAFLVCGASALSAHLGFAAGTEPDMVAPLLAAKLLGGLLGAAVAMWYTRPTMNLSEFAARGIQHPQERTRGSM